MNGLVNEKMKKSLAKQYIFIFHSYNQCLYNFCRSTHTGKQEPERWSHAVTVVAKYEVYV